MLDIESKIKEYKANNRSECFALAQWNNLKMKNFTMREMLECICKAADGSTAEMTNIIKHLTAKKKVHGRTQVYNDGDAVTIDMRRNADGELELLNYNPEAPLPLKGQHHPDNEKIFRKRDDQVSKRFQNAEEKMYDLGAKVRELYPNEDNHFITFAMQAIRKYASEKKISANSVVSRIKHGRYKLDSNNWEITPNMSKNESREAKTIILTEEDISRFKDFLTMTEHKFHTHIRAFISQLLQDPVHAQPSELLKAHNYSRSRLLVELLKMGIIVKDERISDKDENGEPKTATMMVKFKCPKKNFDRKIQKLYIKLFEKNLPPRKTHVEQNEDLNEDGEGGVMGGATSASASGQFIQPMGDVQRRKMPNELEETTATTTVGDYQYVVPFGGDKESLARKNGVGGSVSVNKA